MRISELLEEIESHAPLHLQESYDNAGLQVGDSMQEVAGVLLCIDVTEEVIEEAIAQGCNLIISHHPLIFRGLKSITGKSYVERCVAQAILHQIVLYAAHTNLDNALDGVNFQMAKRIGLQDTSFLLPAERGNASAGSGLIGYLPEAEDEVGFLQRIKSLFEIACIKHTDWRNKLIRKVALCGGSGAFLLDEAKRQQADVYLTADLKYHDYFNAEGKLLLADIGHYESEQFTKELIFEIIRKKNCNFAVRYTRVNTNPIKYL